MRTEFVVVGKGILPFQGDAVCFEIFEETLWPGDASKCEGGTFETDFCGFVAFGAWPCPWNFLSEWPATGYLTG